jgi:hypothetical protein
VIYVVLRPANPSVGSGMPITDGGIFQFFLNNFYYIFPGLQYFKVLFFLLKPEDDNKFI